MNGISNILIQEWRGVPLAIWLMLFCLTMAIVLRVPRIRLVFKGRDRQLELQTQALDQREEQREVTAGSLKNESERPAPHKRLKEKLARPRP